MAQIKVLKIDADGFQSENASSDDLTMATLTGVTQVGVTGGVTLTTDIAFNAATDLIAGIQNQNLLDKTAAETISGLYTYSTLPESSISPTTGNQLTNKTYVDSVATGLSWQQPVLDKDLATPPASPSTGDRYIVAASGTGAWSGHDEDIAEWNGSAWTFETPAEGWALYVDDEDVYYMYDSASNWVKMASVVDHNVLNNLQGGNGSNEYYHMTANEDTWLAAAIAKITAGGDVVGNSVNDTITADWAFTGTENFSGGDLVLPSAVMTTPVEGSTYWDGTNDILYVYDGTAYVDVSSSGTATSVQNTYTAGAGGIAQYDAVYISANDTVLKGSASALSTSKIIGFAPSAIAASSTGVIQEDGILSGVLTGATAGTAYYLDTNAGLITSSIPTGTGNNVVRVGFAKNATDLAIQIQQVGRRA